MPSVTIDADSVRRLVAEAQRGDRWAADRLIREHDSWVRSAIYAVAGRADLVDDVAQQVWTRVWERLPSLEDPQRLRSWLYSVVRNVTIDACMALQRQEQVRSVKAAGAVASRRPESPSAALAADELRQTLLRAVQGLPVIYREPFVLRHLEGWSYAEIARTLNLSVDSVETRLVRARRLLREMLQGKV